MTSTKRDRVVFVHKDPNFRIRVNPRQWVLETEHTCYFPKICLLLDELAEQMFRKVPERIRELKEIEVAVDKVYLLIEETCKGIKENK